MKTLPTFLAFLCACATTSLHAASIAIDFGAGPNGSADPDASVMDLSETAGVVPQQNWNSFTGGTQAVPQALLLDDGLASGSTVTWAAQAVWDTSVNSALDDTPGDGRMMLGYLDTNDTSITTVTVTGIPADFLITGYNVIVYYDGENGTNQRVGAYTLGETTYYGRDGGTVFGGTYTQGQTTTAPTGPQDNNAEQANLVPAGNYLQFSNLNTSSFDLTSQASVSSDAANRAPINGIQIVQIPEPSAILLGFAGAVLGLRRRR